MYYLPLGKLLTALLVFLTVKTDLFFEKGLCEIQKINGFLQSVCYSSPESGLAVYQCPYSEERYQVLDPLSFIPDRDINGYIFNATCTNDTFAYQMCGSMTGWDTFSDEFSLCGYLPCQYGKENFRTLAWSDICNEKRICTNLDLKDLNCSSNTREERAKQLLCNDVCDDMDCKDESNCNGYQYGLICQPIAYYLDYRQVCDGQSDCVGVVIDPTVEGYDELYCSLAISKGFPTCISGSVKGKLVPIFNFTRCNSMLYGEDNKPIPYCKNFLDQTNCTDPAKAAVKCHIQGYGISTVSRYIVCGKISVTGGICSDKMDLQCVRLSSNCKVHKHQQCDGVPDCDDGADERLSICREMTEKQCFRGYVHKKKLRIPLDWLDDGLADCIDGIDEVDEASRTRWPTCGKSETKRYVVENSTCQDLFLCRHDLARFITIKELCDGIDTCGNENKICKISRGISSVSTAVLSVDMSKRLQYCVKGLENIERQKIPCTSKVFNYFKEDVYGMTIEGSLIIFPQDTFDCRHIFGEAYLYLTCLGRCNNAKCPMTRPVRYADCTDDYKNRVYTLVNKNDLTFVTDKRGVYTNNLFVCRNRKCIEYDKVCNLIDDCGDWSDEQNCINNIKCDNNQTYISAAQMCDGKVNCEDWSDECNDVCGQQIINGLVLKCSAFAIGLAATILNIVVTIESIYELQKFNGRVMIVINKILVMLIGVGDLLMGVYLLSVAVVDVLYGSTFCKHRVGWLTSVKCSLLGVISTIAGQISLFSLTLLSLFRALGVKGNINSPGSSNRTGCAAFSRFLRVFASLVVPLLSVTSLMATIPLFASFEDFFVNGMAYDSSIKLFVEPIGKDTHFDLIQNYYGRSQRQTLKWSVIVSLVKNMFSNDYGNLHGMVHRVNFYGNDGVCLFKYFVSHNDPQRIYSLTIQATNIVCFIVVALSYITINVTTVKTSDVLTKTDNPTAKLVRKRNNKLQRKIAAIIATDFACWIPFVVVSGLHYFEVTDASKQYGLFSIVVLPINSVINPFLYSNHIASMAAKLVDTIGCNNRLSRFFRRRVVTKFRRLARRPTYNLDLAMHSINESNVNGVPPVPEDLVHANLSVCQYQNTAL
ncbi:hypothetical protein ACHWQZ_G018917 [Mnemiopsis leidyi]